MFGLFVYFFVCVISILLLFTFHLARLGCLFFASPASAACWYCCSGLKPATEWVTYTFFMRFKSGHIFCLKWIRLVDNAHCCFITWFIRYFFSLELQLIPTGMSQLRIKNKNKSNEIDFQPTSKHKHWNSSVWLFRVFFRFAAINRNMINVLPMHEHFSLWTTHFFTSINFDGWHHHYKNYSTIFHVVLRSIVFVVLKFFCLLRIKTNMICNRVTIIYLGIFLCGSIKSPNKSECTARRTVFVADTFKAEINYA